MKNVFIFANNEFFDNSEKKENCENSRDRMK